MDASDREGDLRMTTATVDETATRPAEPDRRLMPDPPEERAAKGKRARSEVGRGDHAIWEAPRDRPDPVELLRAQEQHRLQDLVPVRHERMLESPFAFFRGAAAIMAADLAQTPTTGLRAQLCGDAHLSNFGGFAAPDRQMVFDLNDFDETLPGPFEWDVKRLAASIEIAGRDRAMDRRQRRSAVTASVREYRTAMRRFAAARALDIWYTRVDAEHLMPALEAAGHEKDVELVRKGARKARSKDSLRAFSRLTHMVDGSPRIVSDPPLIVPLADLLEGQAFTDAERELRDYMTAYKRSLTGAGRHLIDRYRFVDMARKVVGVGSVGTRAWICLMLGRDDNDPLFLQMKEAEPSVLEPYAGKSRYSNHGRRVVEGQWLMQAASDVLLGWVTVNGLDGRRRDFYVRQLWDWKRSADLETMTPRRLELYGRVCGWTLARAHARSGDPIAMGAYLGGGDRFDRALAEFAAAYADQNELDYERFGEAVG
jgi:uncharacterized protein (DUF2252 family)